MGWCINCEQPDGAYDLEMGYGIWTIVLHTCGLLPLALTLFLNVRKAAKLHFLLQSPWQGQTFLGGTRNIWYEIDVMGLLLLSAAVSLILIPLTLAAKAKSGWHNASVIVMLVVGCVCLVVFPLWGVLSETCPAPIYFISTFHQPYRTLRLRHWLFLLL